MLGLTHAERNAPEDTKRVVEQLRKNGTVDSLFSQVLFSGMLPAQSFSKQQQTSASTWLVLYEIEAHASAVAAAAAAGPEHPVPKRECWVNCLRLHDSSTCTCWTCPPHEAVEFMPAGGIQVRGAAVPAEAQAPGRGGQGDRPHQVRPACCPSMQPLATCCCDCPRAGMFPAP